MSYYFIPNESGLPKVTTSFEEYHKTYEDIAKPICDATGAELHGFDPTIQIRYGSSVIDFPPGFLIKLNKTLNKDNKAIIANDYHSDRKRDGSFDDYDYTDRCG